MDAASVRPRRECVRPEVPGLDLTGNVAASDAMPAHQIFGGDENASVDRGSAASATAQAIKLRRRIVFNRPVVQGHWMKCRQEPLVSQFPPTSEHARKSIRCHCWQESAVHERSESHRIQSGRSSRRDVARPAGVRRARAKRVTPNPVGALVSKRRCAPGRSRTCDLRIRSPALYPAELRAQRGGYWWPLIVVSIRNRWPLTPRIKRRSAKDQGQVSAQ
jgi:hypothetical protein